MKKFIILQHEAPVGKAFDFLIHKDCVDDAEILDIKEHGYTLTCRYVEKWIKENKDYIYFWSEDNGHIPTFNWIQDWVNEKEGREDYQLIQLSKEFVKQKDNEVK